MLPTSDRPLANKIHHAQRLRRHITGADSRVCACPLCAWLHPRMPSCFGGAAGVVTAMGFATRAASFRPLADRLAHAVIVTSSSLAALLAGYPSPATLAPGADSSGAPLGPLPQLIAFVSALLPAACLHGWRALMRHQRRLAQQQQPPPRRLIDDLIAEADSATSQPLTGAAGEALRACILEALARDRNHPHGPLALRPVAAPEVRAAALLACRVEAMRRTVAVPPSGVASCTDQAATAASSTCATTAVCKICWDQPCNALLAPCGHVASCLQCLGHMVRTGVDGQLRPPAEWLRCPICVAPVSDVVRAYTC